MASLKLAAKYSKKPPLIYISHLDLVRLLSRAVRRAQLPVKLTEGFNPHYRISFKRALKLGLSSDGEYIEFRLKSWIDPGEFTQRLNTNIPEGVRLSQARYKHE